MHNPFPCVRSLTSSRLHPFPPFQPPRSMLILFFVARASGLTVGKWAAATQQRKLCEARRSNFEVGGTGGGIFLNVVVLDNRVVIFLPSSVVSASRSLTQKRPKRNPKRKQMYTPNLHQRTHSPVIAAAVVGQNRRNETKYNAVSFCWITLQAKENEPSGHQTHFHGQSPVWTGRAAPVRSPRTDPGWVGAPGLFVNQKTVLPLWWLSFLFLLSSSSASS